MQKILSFFLLCACCFFSANSYAQFSLTGGTSTIDFTGYTGTGFSPGVTVAGSLDSDLWAIDYDNDGVLDANFGATNTGNPYNGGTQAGAGTQEVIYAYSVGSGTPAFGIRPKLNNDSDPDEFNAAILKITNNTGGVITELAISYDVFYQVSNNRTIILAFEHSSDNITYIDPGTLDFTVTASVGGTWTAGTSPSATITGLSIADGDDYFLKWIFEDANNASNAAVAIDQISITPTTVNPASTSTLTAGTTSSATISSLVTSSTGQVVFDFTILDDGATPSSDVFETMISEIVISEASGDQFTDWSDVLAGASITDGTTSATATSIGTNTITFNGFNFSTSGDLGFIADNASKTYTLSVWFDTDISESIDGNRFQFTADASGITFFGASSSLISTETASSSTTNNVADVAATEWQFKDVPNSVGTGLEFNLTVVATDVNGNVDADETTSFDLAVNSGPGTISSATGLTNTAVVAGSFTYTDLIVDTDGSYTLSATTNTGTALTTGVSSTLVAAEAYRSITTGNWSATGTWEIFTGGVWTGASSSPTNLDGPITIQAGHTVTFDAAATVDQVTIESTATLVLNAALTLEDLSGENDIVVEGTLEVPAGGHDFGTAGGTVEVKENGVVTTGNDGIEDDLAGEDSSGIFIYRNGAIFEYTNTSINGFASETYFPDVTSEIPIFRISINGNLNNMNNFVVNGILQVNNNLSFGNSTIPIDIRNGVTGDGDLTFNVPFTLSGDDITFGGSGTFNMGGDDLNFSSGTTITLTSDKEIQNGSLTFSSGSVVEAASFKITDGTANNLTVNVNSGNTLKVTGADGLVSGGDPVFEANTFNAGTEINYEFNGTATQSTNFSTFGVTEAGSITINNTFGVNLTEAITINTGIILTAGIFNTDAGTPSIASGATITGGSTTEHIDGPVTIENFNASFTIPVGDAGDYRPVIMNPVNSSTFTISHTTGVPVDNADLDGISDLLDLRYWTITRASGTGDVEVTLTIDAAADGFTPDADNLLSRYNTTSTRWETAGTGYDSHTSTTVTATISDFSDFTVASSSTLPVELDDFSASATIDGVVLDWNTLSELNNDLFEVHKSTDGINFEVIAQLDGAGTTAIAQDYQFVDYAPFAGNNYYRLRQVDFDGQSSLSRIVHVVYESGQRSVTIQNPVVDKTLQIRAQGLVPGEPVNYHIYSLSGQTVMQNTEVIDQYNWQNQIPLNKLESGIYVFELVHNGLTTRRKLIID